MLCGLGPVIYLLCCSVSAQERGCPPCPASMLHTIPLLLTVIFMWLLHFIVFLVLPQGRNPWL